MNARSRQRALVAGALLTTGCTESPRSCELDTGALVMFATISDIGTTQEVEIEFLTEADDADMFGTALALCPGTDVLTVNGREADKQLTLGHLYYTAVFTEQDDGYIPEFDIILQRKDGVDVEATVVMPPRFEFDTPAAGSEHSRANELSITWGPAWPDHQIELAVEDEIGSTCIDGLGYYGDPVDDNGSFVLPANALSGPAGGRCEVKVSLTRVLESPYPEVLAPGGSLTAVVNRRLPFQSID